jgi:hypothetical protein
MDSVVIDLLKGPTGDDAVARIAWLKKTHYAVASGGQGSIAQMAEPLRQAIEIAEKLEKAPDTEKPGAEAVLMGLMVKVQGLALYSYLEELNKMRNAVAGEAAKLKAGTPEKKKAETLQSAYEQALDGLARAYNGMRSGNFEEMKAIGPVMEKVRKVADELRK